MLATPREEPFDSPDFWFEVKWDGVRCLAFLEPGRVRLQSRNLHDVSARYPALLGLNRHLRGPRQAVVDGELLGFAGALPSFQASVRTGGATAMVAFDLLHLDGLDLLTRPLEERRAALERSFGFGEDLVCPAPVAGRGRGLYQAAVEQGLEGVVAKRLGSAYRPGARSRDWLKTAHRRILDCVICGLTAGAVPVSAAGQAFSFGSLVLGCWTEAGGRGPEPSAGGLAYLGNVGTGWDQAGLGRLLAQVRPRASSPFAPGRGPPRRVARETLWLEPLLVAEVAYREVTPDGVLRHPSFLGLREDKAPRECGPPPGRGGG